MKIRYLLALIGTSCGAGVAHAGDKPLFAPVPEWVKPAPAIDAAKLTDASPVLLLFDTQQRLADGQVWSYVDTATRASSPEVLNAIGTVKVPWQPAQGDLIVHRLEIIRGTEHIDLLKDGKAFTVLRREQGIDNRMLDGMLTATMPVEGLRVGDVLHLTASVTRRDATLKGAVQTVAPVMFDPLRITFARVRLLWPVADHVQWRAYAKDVKATPVVAGGISDLTIALPLAKPADLPDDAPVRFRSLPIVEASSFADWAAVSAVMAPLYKTEGTIAPGSPLKAEAVKIMAADKDPLKRAAAALQLVQDKIRYLLLGMDTGNYVPQAPALTWSVRYGDCKAKTVLLLALLREMGIEAEPVLANSKLGDAVPGRIAAPAAFDHVLVRATIAGEVLWLDGTASGDRLADIRDTPAFGYVLPVRPSGATLIQIPVHADARPSASADIALDETPGLELPATFTATVTMRGPAVAYLRVAAAQGSKEDLTKLAGEMVKPFLSDAVIGTRALGFDEATGTATLSATGITYTDWARKDGRMETPLDPLMASTTFSPDRARAAWRDIPVAAGNPDYISVRTTTHLPGGTFTLVADQPLSAKLGVSQVDRTIGKSDDLLTVDTKIRNSGVEISPAAIPDARKQFALVKARAPRAQAAIDYPARWQDAQAGTRAHRFDGILAVYQQRIEASPDKAEPYSDRAWFYARIYNRKAAVADYTRAIAIEPDVPTYLRRSGLYEELGDTAKALADADAARQIDSSSGDALRVSAALMAERGDAPGGLALLQERIDNGGDDKPEFLTAKAAIQARVGDKAGALETSDAAVLAAPGKTNELNARCWIKGLLDTALDTALKDCTKAIEVSESATAAIDSRGLIYFRLKRYDDALADYDAVLALNPDHPPSLYMRGVVRRRTGKVAAGDADLAAARFLSPRIDETYRKFGIVP